MEIIKRDGTTPTFDITRISEVLFTIFYGSKTFTDDEEETLLNKIHEKLNKIHENFVKLLSKLTEFIKMFFKKNKEKQKCNKIYILIISTILFAYIKYVTLISLYITIVIIFIFIRRNRDRESESPLLLRLIICNYSLNYISISTGGFNHEKQK